MIREPLAEVWEALYVRDVFTCLFLAEPCVIVDAGIFEYALVRYFTEEWLFDPLKWKRWEGRRER
ncbi:MAG: hypothetical protein Kow0069_06780 [Promethearchaeota archaeon]